MTRLQMFAFSGSIAFAVLAGAIYGAGAALGFALSAGLVAAATSLALFLAAKNLLGQVRASRSAARSS